MQNVQRSRNINHTKNNNYVKIGNNKILWKIKKQIIIIKHLSPDKKEYFHHGNRVLYLFHE